LVAAEGENMAKGFFTQGVCLLTDGHAQIEGVKAALQEKEFEVVKETPPGETWCFGGASLVVPYRPDFNGYVAVDVVDHSWPDDMGDPKSSPMIFGAWSMGHFGPFAFPGGLARAGQHAWAWQPGRTISQQHRGFIRIRMSYCFGASDDSPILPEECDPREELMFLSQVVMAVLNAPGVICYFNPNGEVLRDRQSFSALWDQCEMQQIIPLPLWSNVRFFNLNEQLGLMDTVGNNHLDIQDVEAIFPHAAYDPGQIDSYLRDVTLYLLDLEREIHTGEDIDGPGETNLSWTIEVLENGTMEPPRRLLRIYPNANRKEIRAALKAVGRLDV
jgi:hypothetical protein